MNLLQAFMAACNVQARTINQEEVTIDGDSYFGTFSDPQMLPDMERWGYTDVIAKIFIADRAQFSAPFPEPRTVLTRVSSNTEYLIQMVDTKDPVVLTFMLVDREA